MSEKPQHDFRNTALDPDLLLTPFGVQTNWHVITGTVSSGKTTLIDQLADRGFQTVPEAARQYYEAELARGRMIVEIRQDMATVIRDCIDMMLEAERGLRANDVVFLDRGVPDVLAFCRLHGQNPNEILANCFDHRYASVFLLDGFPVEEDGVRTEDDVTAELLDEWHARDYSALGYSVVRVPVLSPEKRLAFVLERLTEQGLI